MRTALHHIHALFLLPAALLLAACQTADSGSGDPVPLDFRLDTRADGDAPTTYRMMLYDTDNGNFLRSGTYCTSATGTDLVPCTLATDGTPTPSNEGALRGLAGEYQLCVVSPATVTDNNDGTFSFTPGTFTSENPQDRILCTASEDITVKDQTVVDLTAPPQVIPVKNLLKDLRATVSATVKGYKEYADKTSPEDMYTFTTEKVVFRGAGKEGCTYTLNPHTQKLTFAPSTSDGFDITSGLVYIPAGNYGADALFIDVSIKVGEKHAETISIPIDNSKFDPAGILQPQHHYKFTITIHPTIITASLSVSPWEVHDNSVTVGRSLSKISLGTWDLGTWTY